MQETARENPTTFGIVERIDAAIAGMNPIKVMLGIGAIGMSICYSAIEYGSRAFVLGFLLMICSALGCRSISEADA